jgi:hypothetical protein
MLINQQRTTVTAVNQVAVVAKDFFIWKVKFT